MSKLTTVMERLRRETQSEHTAIEALLFARALSAGQLPLASYVGLLRALSAVYDVLEQIMRHAQHPQLATVWQPSMHKLPLIDRDLGFFQRHDLPQTPVAVLRAHLLTQSMRGRAVDDPLSLLG